ncbi:cytochrome P450 [Spirillospora sp. CA-255316]
MATSEPPAQPAPYHPESLEHHASAAERLTEARRCPVTYPMPGIGVVARYQDVRAVLADNERFSAKGNFSIHSDDPPGGRAFITMMDPPEHTALRSRYLDWFSPGKVRAMRPQIRGIVGAVLDGLDPTQPVDAYGRIARQVPSRVLYALIGFPERDWEQLQAWHDAINAHVPRPINEVPEFFKVGQYMLNLVAERAAGPPTGEDMIDDFVHPPQGALAFDHQELATRLSELLAAGTETTTMLMTNLLYELLADRAKWQRVTGDHKLIENAIEESLRKDTPIQFIMRKAKRDMEIDGCLVRAGDKLILQLQSADWDESVWGQDAQEFEPQRPRKPGHLAFGMGIHSCLGALLARLETLELIDEMTRRYPNARLAEDYQWRLHRDCMARRPEGLQLLLAPSHA